MLIIMYNTQKLVTIQKSINTTEEQVLVIMVNTVQIYMNTTVKLKYVTMEKIVHFVTDKEILGLIPGI
ncbi:hypothetical protein EF514_08380 [Anaerosphaera multitolerans]|uniref:Uncharacterized protein n=1 Tax=Anaerosphaera multitolerans TaxID=2487351 RepID=A0A437S5W9_9FIRM|nr:hypothetical protein EF514_08380 [Anaerosphaera multitolerans]